MQSIAIACLSIALLSLTQDLLSDPGSEAEDWISSLLFESFVVALAASLGFGGIASCDNEEDWLLWSLFLFFSGAAVFSFTLLGAGIILFSWHTGYTSMRQTVLFSFSLCAALVAPLRSIPRAVRQREI
jgi:hypothetical protein